MFSSSRIVLTILGLFAGFSLDISNGLEIREKRSVLYHGPLAPINSDGTVALTPEVQQAKVAHQAAFAAEFRRLKEAERLAAAHSDLTSPKHSYDSKRGLYRSEYNQAISQQYYPQTLIQAPLNHDGTVTNIASSYGYGSYSKGNQNQQNTLQYSQEKSYNHRPQVYIPAPLNKDGTVGLTPEVQQARAAHQAAFAAEFQRLDEAARLAAAYPDLTSPQKGYSSNNKGYYIQNDAAQHIQNNPQAHSPVQLKQYVTYANTAKVQNAAAVQAAFAAEFKRLQYAANLAAAHPDLTSQNTYSSAKSKIQYHANQGSHYAYNPLARVPAPLNSDGTVAHTPEYRAIAAAHQAEYAKALLRNKHHGYFSSSQQFRSNNHYGHY